MKKLVFSLLLLVTTSCHEVVASQSDFCQLQPGVYPAQSQQDEAQYEIHILESPACEKIAKIEARDFRQPGHFQLKNLMRLIGDLFNKTRVI